MFDQGFDVTVEVVQTQPQCVSDYQINTSFVINGQRYGLSRIIQGHRNVFGRNHRGLYIADVAQFDALLREMRHDLASAIADKLHPRVYLEGR